MKKGSKKHNIFIKNQNKKSGFAVLIVIVVISAVALIIAYSSSILGLGEMSLGYTESKAKKSFWIAEGCLENSLEQLWLDENYTGGIIPLGENSCEVFISENIGDKIITIMASTTDNYFQKTQTIISQTGKIISINSWQELEN